MLALDRFAETYLAQWERLATVRSARRSVVPAGVGADGLFPEMLQSFCRDPAVVALGAEARRFILVQGCLFFCHEIALVETDVVSGLATALANRPQRVELSAPVRQVALTIAVDEAYHAFAAREFVEQVEQATGLRTIAPPDRCGLELALRAGHAETPREALDMFDVLTLCIAENTITADILGLKQETAPDNPFHVALEEHLVDERRHQGYFQLVLAHYWAGLDDDERRMVTPGLAAFVGRFITDTEPFRAHDATVLAAAGLPAAEARRIVDASYDGWPAELETGIARNIRRVLDRAGVLGHAPTAEALQRCGLRLVAPATEGQALAG